MMNSIVDRFRNIPPVTKNLLIINLIMWLFTSLFGVSIENRIYEMLALHYFEAPDFNGFQLVTYMFLHNGFFHLFFNMFTLYMFGSALEYSFGSKRFLLFYLTCGVGAGLVQEVVWAFTWESLWAEYIVAYNNLGYSVAGMDLSFLNNMLTVGASGAVFGLLLAFAMIYPNIPLYFMFIPVPIKAKWMMLGYGLIELSLAMSLPNSSIAHFAHLGGMIFGLLMILYWKKRGEIRVIY